MRPARLIAGESYPGRVRDRPVAASRQERRYRNPDRDRPGWTKPQPSEVSGIAMRGLAPRLPIARTRLPSEGTPTRAFARTTGTNQTSWKGQLPVVAHRGASCRWSTPQTARRTDNYSCSRSLVTTRCRGKAHSIGARWTEMIVALGTRRLPVQSAPPHSHLRQTREFAHG